MMEKMETEEDIYVTLDHDNIGGTVTEMELIWM